MRKEVEIDVRTFDFPIVDFSRGFSNGEARNKLSLMSEHLWKFFYDLRFDTFSIHCTLCRRAKTMDFDDERSIGRDAFVPSNSFSFEKDARSILHLLFRLCYTTVLTQSHYKRRENVAILQRSVCNLFRSMQSFEPGLCFCQRQLGSREESILRGSIENAFLSNFFDGTREFRETHQWRKTGGKLRQRCILAWSKLWWCRDFGVPPEQIPTGIQHCQLSLRLGLHALAAGHGGIATTRNPQFRCRSIAVHRQAGSFLGSVFRPSGGIAHNRGQLHFAQKETHRGHGLFGFDDGGAGEFPLSHPPLADARANLSGLDRKGFARDPGMRDFSLASNCQHKRLRLSSRIQLLEPATGWVRCGCDCRKLQRLLWARSRSRSLRNTCNYYWLIRRMIWHNVTAINEKKLLLLWFVGQIMNKQWKNFFAVIEPMLSRQVYPTKESEQIKN